MVEAHSGEHLATILVKILEEYNIVNKLHCITSDNASNNLSMVKEVERLLEERDIEWDHTKYHIPCITHVINIAVQKFLASIKSDCLEDGTRPSTASSHGVKFSDMVAKARTIAKSIRASPQQWKQFQLICETYQIKPLKIYIDVSTRWNSTHRMLERCIFLRKAVHRYAENHPDLQTLSDKEWELMELLCAFLWPFKNCTDCLQGTTKPEVDRVFWAYNRMFNEIDDFRDTLERREVKRQPWTAELKTALTLMENRLRKYYQKTESPAVYVDAMILHPKIKLAMFKTAEWNSGDAEVYRKESKDRYDANYAGLKLNPSSEPSTSRKRTAGEMEEDDYDKFLENTFGGDDRHEFDTYIASPRENVKSALDYWRNYHRQSPRLGRMVRDVFSVPPSGSGVERQFSIAGRVATWQRNKLSAKTISQIMMYKNHMDRSGRSLEIASEWGELTGFGEIESEDEEHEQEEQAAVKTLMEWRSNWKAGLKKMKT